MAIPSPRLHAVESSILATLSYFDIFSYPLTAFEIWRHLWWEEMGPAPRFREIADTLQQSARLAEQVDRKNGYWFFRGRGVSVERRAERYLLAERKYRRVLRAVRWIRLLPFVRAVFVCNSLAFHNASVGSDLDLFLITAPQRVWTARLFVTGFASLAGMRPSLTKTQDGLCLSFYLADTATTISDLSIDDDDPYLHYWVDHLCTVFSVGDTADRFLSANTWIRERLPNACGVATSSRRRVLETRTSRIVRRFGERVLMGRVGEGFERFARLLQARFLPASLRALANRDTRVMMSDRLLKFHDNDRREEYRAAFRGRLEEVLER